MNFFQCTFTIKLTDEGQAFIKGLFNAPAEIIKPITENVTRAEKAPKNPDHWATPELVVELWNTNTLLQKCLALNPKRKKKLEKLCKEFPYQMNWIDIIAEAGACRFAREDGKEWIPNIDWLLYEGKALWLLERNGVETAEKRRKKFLEGLENPVEETDGVEA